MQRSAWVAPFVSILFIVACSPDDEQQPLADICTKPGGSCDSGTDGGSGDTGGTEGTGSDGGDPESEPGCITEKDGTTRVVHTCVGEANLQLDFSTILGGCEDTIDDVWLCDQTIEFFPPDDPPAVMACCDVLPDAKDSIYLQHCSLDLAEQVCKSIVATFDIYIASGGFGAFGGAAQNLRNYVSGHQQQCWNALHDFDPSGATGPNMWEIPNSLQWPGLTEAKFTLSAVVTHVDVPPDPEDQVACEDISLNDTEVLSDQVPPPIFGVTDRVALESTGAASLTGPEVLGGLVLAESELASGCTGPRCSNMAVHTDGSTVSLRELELYPVGSVRLSNGTVHVDVENLSIRLFRTAEGVTVTDASGQQRHEFAAGDAAFVVAGVSDFGTDRRVMTNSSTLALTPVPGGFRTDAFELSFEQSDGGVWEVEVPASDWD